MNAIVYITTNTINGKKYIGSHNGKKSYYLGSGRWLKQAIKKYGIENFKRQVLWEGSIEYMREMEEYYIDYYNASTSDLFYNISPKGIGNPRNRTLEEERQYRLKRYHKNKKLTGRQSEAYLGRGPKISATKQAKNVSR